MTQSKGNEEVKHEVPEGFTQSDTDLDSFPKWDFDKNPSLGAIVIKVKDATVTDRKGVERETRLAVVDVKGEKHILWMSANLENFFADIEPGMLIRVNYNGIVPLGNGNSMRDFDAYYKHP